jgi:hypothetical protein
MIHKQLTIEIYGPKISAAGEGIVKLRNNGCVVV